MNDRLKWRMWSTHAGRYFDETNDAMLENVFECMKQQICYDCQNPVFRKIYDRIAYNHIADGMVFEQCTGLKDRNGSLIYAGDILGNKDFMSDVALLTYNNEKCCYILERRSIDECFNKWWADRLMVIGNIHENKELLK